MKKKLIMILCAVASLSLAACGGTVETDSDSRTEREVEDDDKDDDKDKKKSKSKTIFDEISLYETTLDDIEEYLDDKDIIFSYNDNGVTSWLAEDFLGYDCYYDLISFEKPAICVDENGEEVYTLRTKEDYLAYRFSKYSSILMNKYPNTTHIKESDYSIAEDATGKECLSYLQVKVLYKNNEDLVEGQKAIVEYLQDKADLVEEYEVYWDNTSGIVYFPISVTRVDDVKFIEYLEYEQRHYSESSDGYMNDVHVIDYKVIPEDEWNSLSFIQTDTPAVTQAESAVTEAPASASEATASSTKTEKPASDSASTTSQVESERKGFFPRSDIDYQALSDKFAGTYVPVDGDTEFMIHEYDEERVSYSQENGTAYMFMEQYRLDWWDYSHIISFDGTTVELSYGEEYGVVKLIYIDENTVSYRGKKYTRYKEDSQTLENVDVESEVATIRDYYYATQNNLGNYMLEEHQNLTMYHEAGYPVKIFIKSGYNDWDYTREYFYHDQELYFAFVYNNNEQHRLYFKDGIMIRYIDENGNTYDYGSLDAYSDWADKVKNESNGIYPTMPNCGA